MKMMRKKLSLILIVLLLFGCSRRDASPGNSGTQEFKPKGDISDLAYNPVRPDGSIDSSYLPIMELETKEFDFGMINEGDIVKKEFQLKNTGTAPLLILNATSSCGCTVPEWPEKPIPPDSTASIVVKFDSKNKPGPQNKEVTIFANTIPNKTILSIRGVVDSPKN